MAPKKGGACKTCKRTFTDQLKQKGTLAQCSPCFYFVKGHPSYKNLSRAQLLDLLADPQKAEEFNSGLQEWENDRQSGKVRKSSVTVCAEAKSGLSTRVLKGYLWTKDLLEKKGDGGLWKKGNQTTVSHMGKSVMGVLRETWCMGAIEVYEDSSISATRVNVAEEVDAMDCDQVAQANDTFSSLRNQLATKEVEDEEGNMVLRAAGKKEDDFMDLWGVSSSVGGPSPAAPNRNRQTEKEPDQNKRPAQRAKQNPTIGTASTAGEPVPG